MKPWSLSLATVLCLALTACARNSAAVQPAPPAPVDPVGTFDFSTSLEGNTVTGSIVITRTDAGYGGTMTSSATDPVPVSSVAVAGQKVTVTANTPDGPVVFTMDFTGDEFTGTWSFATMSGTHSGKRRKA